MIVKKWVQTSTTKSRFVIPTKHQFDRICFCSCWDIWSDQYLRLMLRRIEMVTQSLLRSIMVETRTVWSVWGWRKLLIQCDTGQLLGGNCFSVTKTLHWLHELGCNTAVTPSIQLNHTRMAQQQECESPCVALLKQGLDLIENLWNDLMIAAGQAIVGMTDVSHLAWQILTTFAHKIQIC